MGTRVLALVLIAVAAYAAAQSPAVWTVDSVGFFTSNGQRTHRRIVLRGPLDAPVPARGSRWTLAAPPAPPPPPPPAAPVFGTVAPDTLGTCSAAIHDQHVVSGNDGIVYRTWHPQRDPSGCIYAHEHGPDPAPAMADLVRHIDAHAAAGRYSPAQAAQLRALATAPLAFGYATRRMNHQEPHEGFKVFIATQGECNDEDRCSRMSSMHVTHMGTGGVGRFTRQHHSVESRQVHDSGAYQFTSAMLDFGTADVVCDPRQAPTRDFIALGSRCEIDSPYEIWSGQIEVRDDAGMVARFFATPAAFDPITVMNRANPSELVYAWDPRVLQTRRHDGDDWSSFRGCDRESYAQPGVYERAGSFDLWTDVHGRVVPAGTALAIRQVFGAGAATSDLRGATPNASDVPAGNAGNHAYKVRRDTCGLRAALGLKN